MTNRPQANIRDKAAPTPFTHRQKTCPPPTMSHPEEKVQGVQVLKGALLGDNGYGVGAWEGHVGTKH